MQIFCPVDRLRLAKSDDTYGGVSHTTIVSDEMVHRFSCNRKHYVYMMGKMQKKSILFISSL